MIKILGNGMMDLMAPDRTLRGAWHGLRFIKTFPAHPQNQRHPCSIRMSFPTAKLTQKHLSTLLLITRERTRIFTGSVIGGEKSI
jgi:hypothetical protein